MLVTVTNLTNTNLSITGLGVLGPKQTRKYDQTLSVETTRSLTELARRNQVHFSSGENPSIEDSLEAADYKTAFSSVSGARPVVVVNVDTLLQASSSGKVVYATGVGERSLTLSGCTDVTVKCAQGTVTVSALGGQIEGQNTQTLEAGSGATFLLIPGSSNYFVV